MLVADHILQHRAEAVGGGVDLRLGFPRQVDHLGIAAAFEVEGAVFAPAVLVVADQAAVRVGGQRRLAGAGQAEEQRDVFLGADIGAAMHRQDALGGQDPVHHGEDRFLDLAGVFGAGDDDELLLERQRDGGRGPRAVDRRIGLEQRRVQDDVVGLEALQFMRWRADEHIASEQGSPGVRGDQPHPHAMRRVGAGVQVLGEQVLTLQIGLHARLQHRELLGRVTLVDVAPPDVAGDRRLIDHELVAHRAAGMDAGFHHQRAVDRQPAFPAAQRLGDQSGRREIGMYRAAGMHAGAGKRRGGVFRWLVRMLCQCPFPVRQSGLWSVPEPSEPAFGEVSPAFSSGRPGVSVHAATRPVAILLCGLAQGGCLAGAKMRPHQITGLPRRVLPYGDGLIVRQVRQISGHDYGEIVAEPRSPRRIRVDPRA